MSSEELDSIIMENCLVSQPGPSYPTDASIDFYRQANQDLVTITSSAPFDQACLSGIPYCVFAQVLNSDFDQCKYFDLQIATEIIFSNFESELFEDDFLLQDKEHIIQHSLPNQLQIEVPTRNSKGDLDETVELIKSHFDISNISNFGVILLPRIHFCDIFNESQNEVYELKIEQNIALTNSQNQTIANLIKIQMNDKYVVVLEEKMEMYSYYSLEQQNDTSSKSIATRILFQLGIKDYLIIGGVVSLDPEINVGDIVFPTDQINFSCRNPTIGRNIDSWGMRFYDCSNIYCKSGSPCSIESIESILNNSGIIKTHKTGIIYLNGSKPDCLNYTPLTCIHT